MKISSKHCVFQSVSPSQKKLFSQEENFTENYKKKAFLHQNCDKTQNSNCDNNQILAKLKYSNRGKTQHIRL